MSTGREYLIRAATQALAGPGLEKRAAGAHDPRNIAWGLRGLKSVGEGIAAQFRPKNWGAALSAHGELLKNPSKVLAEGARESFKLGPGVLGKVGPAATGAILASEAHTALKSGKNIPESRRRYLEQAHGPEGVEAYRSAKQKAHVGEWGHSGERAGRALGSIGSWMATAARKSKFLPAVITWTLASQGGAQLGRKFDRLRGRKLDPVDRRADSERFREMKAYVDAARRGPQG